MTGDGELEPDRLFSARLHHARLLVVVPPATDLMADGSEDPEDGTDENQQHPDGPQDADARQQAEDE